MDDKEKRIRAAIANLEEEFSTIVIVWLPANRAGCPIVVHTGDHEVAWAITKLAERTLRDDRSRAQQN